MGYEMWVSSEYQRALYDLLTHAGADHGLKVIGGRALNALRLEKSFGTWAREFRPIYGPIEAGLGRFVDFSKADFIGKAAALKERDSGGERTLITLSVDTAAHDAIGDEPIFHNGEVVGWVTSGGYGHTIGASLAMGYVNNAVAAFTDGFAVELVGKMCPAIRMAEAPVDPKGTRMRA
jgi:dimethylglycine dehydrogenase